MLSIVAQAIVSQESVSRSGYRRSGVSRVEEILNVSLHSLVSLYYVCEARRVPTWATCRDAGFQLILHRRRGTYVFLVGISYSSTLETVAHILKREAGVR